MGLQRLDISAQIPARPQTISPVVKTERDVFNYMEEDHHLVRYFEDYICPRILPLSKHHYEQSPDGTRAADPIVEASRQFPPLHHAICAISLLSLHYKGQARWEDALARDMQATRLLSRSVTSDNDLVSDGVFFLHFLLLVYDISNPLHEENLWFQHL